MEFGLFSSFRSVVALLIVVVAVVSCDDSREDRLSEKEMVALMTDMQLAEAYASVQTDMTIERRKRIGERVLADHGVDRAMLDSTMSWYGRNIDDYEEMLRKVDRNLEKMQMKYSGAHARPDIMSEKNNLWPGSRNIMISHGCLRKGVLFEVCDPELQKGDALTWHMRMLGDSGGAALLGVDYTDGSSHIVKGYHRGSRKFEVRLQTDSSRTVRRIFGYFRNTSESDLPSWADSISLVRQNIDTMRYNEISSQRLYARPMRRIASALTGTDTIIPDKAGVVQESVYSHNKSIAGSEAGRTSRSDVSPSKLMSPAVGGSGDKVDRGFRRK